MLRALGLVALAAGAPQEAAPPAATAPASAERLCRDFAERLARAEAVHVVARATLLSPEPAREGEAAQDPPRVRRWALHAQAWMLSGRRCRATVRWSEVPAEGAPAAPARTQTIVSDGERACSWFEGEPTFRCRRLGKEPFVPYPLPELFAAQHGGLASLPPLADAEGFRWSEELGELPCVALLDAGASDPQPVTWVAFQPRSGLPAGSCTLFPDAWGGDTLQLVVERLELDARPPEDLVLRPPEGLREAPGSAR